MQFRSVKEGSYLVLSDHLLTFSIMIVYTLSIKNRAKISLFKVFVHS